MNSINLINQNTTRHVLSIKFLLVIILLFNTINASYSQDMKINGKTVSKTNLKPIDFASVLIIDTAKDSLVVAYTQTDKNGLFQFQIDKVDTKNYIFKILKLGFEVTFDALKANENPQIIYVSDAYVELQEVTIKTKRPIRIKKDTTSYSLKQFSDGTERNLEDALKKLPGIKISDKGVISFNGKSISKILIEGDNFFSSDYQILSKNITPNIISDIDAIENYNDNELLRGIKKSNQVVLNLNLDKNLKVSLFGNITGGLGVKERYIASGVLFSLLQKIKLGYIGNVNNIGEKSLNLVQDNFGASNTASRSRSIPSFISSIKQSINVSDIFIPNLDRNRYIDNTSSLQAFQTNLQISPIIKFRNYGYFYFDKFKNTSNNRTVFLGDENNTVILEESKIKNNKRFFFNNSHLSIKPDSLSSIHITTNFSKSKPESSNDISNIFSNQDSDRVISNNTDDLRSFEYDIEYSRKMSSSALLQFYSNYKKRNIDQNLLLIGDRFINLFSSQQVLENLKLDETISYLGFNYIKDFEKHNIELSFNYLKNKSSLKSVLTRVELGDAVDGFNNDFNYLQDNYRLKIAHNFNFTKRISLSTKLFLNNLYVSTIDNLSLADKKRNINFIESKFNLEYKGRKGHRFRLFGSIEKDVASINDLISNTVFTDLRNVERYTNQINISNDLSLNFYYSYFDRKNFHRFSIGGNYSYVSSPYTFNLETSDFLNTIFKLPSDIGNNNGSLYGDTNKLIYPIKSRLGIKGHLGYSEISRVTNNNLYFNQETYNYSLGTYLYTAFNGWVNFKANVDFTQNIVPKSIISQKFVTDRLDLEISSIVKPSKSLNAKFIYQRIQWPNLNSDIFDVYINYSPKKIPKFSGKFVVRNLFNTKSLAFDNFSPTVINENEYNIVPRLVYLSLTWNLGV